PDRGEVQTTKHCLGFMCTISATHGYITAAGAECEFGGTHFLEPGNTSSKSIRDGGFGCSHFIAFFRILQSLSNYTPRTVSQTIFTEPFWKARSRPHRRYRRIP